jgi:hypothetical protein
MMRGGPRVFFPSIWICGLVRGDLYVLILKDLAARRVGRLQKPGAAVRRPTEERSATELNEAADVLLGERRIQFHFEKWLG